MGTLRVQTGPASGTHRHSAPVTGRIFDVRRHSMHDGPGIRTTVFMKGCPLSCAWCHNPEGIGFGRELEFREERCIACGTCLSVCQGGALAGGVCTVCGNCASVCPAGARTIIGRDVEPSALVAELLRDEQFYDASEGGVTFSGGEPLSQAEFVMEAARFLKKRSVHITIDTSGFVPSETMSEAASLADLVLYDLKHMNDDKHTELAGVSNKIIHSNIRLLADAGANVMISVPLIPGMNDDDENLEATAAFVAGLKPSGQIGRAHV